MSKGEMAVIVTISRIAGLVVLALVFTISDAEPSDFPGWLLLIAWLTISIVIHAALTSRKKKAENKPWQKELLAGKIIDLRERQKVII